MDYRSPQSNGCRILEYHHRNSTFVRLENELLSVVVWIDKGADITEILYKPIDLDFMWKAPVGITDITHFIPTNASHLGNNLDYYEGGWHESLPGGGPYSDHGCEQGLHGEAALLPWSFFVEKDSSEQITILLKCRLVRIPIDVQKRITMKRNSAAIFFSETLTNRSNEKIEFMWGQHPTFGKPFISEYCRIDLPASQFIVSPTFETGTGLFEKGTKAEFPEADCRNGKKVNLSGFPKDGIRQADIYIFEPTEGWYTMSNIEMGIGFGMSWDKNRFPFIWYWKVLNGLENYPWFNSTYCIGMEFWNGWPDYPLAKEKRLLTTLMGCEKLKTDYTAVVFPSNGEKISNVEINGNVIKEK